MLKIIDNKLGIALIALTLFTLGCANTERLIEDDGESGGSQNQSGNDEDGDDTGNSGKDSGNGDDDSKNSGNESGKGGQNSGSNNTACAVGAKRCTGGMPQVCVDHKWTDKEACTSGMSCVDGECVSGSSCQAPLVLEAGKKVEGSTLGGKAEHLGTKCNNALNSTEGVVKVVVPETAYYDFAVEATGLNDITYYASPVCDGDDMVMPKDADWCGYNATYDEFRTLLNKGEMYMFMEPATANSADFSVDFKKSANQNGWECYSGTSVEITTSPINVFEGASGIKGDTSSSDLSHQNPMTQCDIYTSTGKEVVYAFFVDRPTNIRAKLTNVKAVDPTKTSAKSIFYVSACGGPDMNGSVNKQKGWCSVSDATTNILTAKDLTPGYYNLIVDSESGNDISFELEVKTL